MTHKTLLALATVALFTACDPETVTADECLVAEDIHACKATACWLEGTVLHCDAVWSLPDGHRGDFSIGTPGDQPWNEWPYNANAGDWEDAAYRGGDAPACGHVSVDTAMIERRENGERSVLLICDDVTMHRFEVHYVHLTDAGPVPD